MEATLGGVIKGAVVSMSLYHFTRTGPLSPT